MVYTRKRRGLSSRPAHRLFLRLVIAAAEVIRRHVWQLRPVWQSTGSNLSSLCCSSCSWPVTRIYSETHFGTFRPSSERRSVISLTARQQRCAWVRSHWMPCVALRCGVASQHAAVCRSIPQYAAYINMRLQHARQRKTDNVPHRNATHLIRCERTFTVSRSTLVGRQTISTSVFGHKNRFEVC